MPCCCLAREFLLITSLGLWLVSTMSSQKRDITFLVLAGILWGTSFPAITYGLQYTTPVLFLLLRFLFASIIAGILFPSSVKRVLTSKDMVIVGLLNAIAYLLQFVGQQWVPAGQSALLVNSYSILVPFFAYFMIRERLTIEKILAAIIGLLGVGFITNQDSGGVSATKAQYVLGVITIFLAGTIWALYVVFTKRMQILYPRENSYASHTSEISQDVFVASMFYTVFLATGVLVFSNEPLTFPLQAIVAAIYLAIFCSTIPLLLYLGSLENIDAGISAIILLLEVLVAFIISAFYFEEQVILRQIFGATLILIGIFLAIRETNHLQE